MRQTYIAKSKTLDYETKYRLHFITITSDVERFVEESGIHTGTVTLQTHHTTAGIWLNEDEKNLVGLEEELGYRPDIKRIVDRFADPSETYHHNDVCSTANPNGRRDTHLCEPDENGIIPECLNGHSHAHSLLFPGVLTMIIENGVLCRGIWQQILLVELDHDRTRKVTMLAQGETNQNAT